MIIKKRNKGQSTIEYAMLIACLVAALLAMQIYIKRAIQGRMREASDSIGEQYAPQHVTDAQFTIKQEGYTVVESEEVEITPGQKDFGMQTTISTHETVSRYGHEYMDEFEKDLFD